MPSTVIAHAVGDGSQPLPAIELITALLASVNAAGSEAQFYSSLSPKRVIHVGWYALLAYGSVVWWRYLDHETENSPIYRASFYADAVQWHFNGGADIYLEVFY